MDDMSRLQRTLLDRPLRRELFAREMRHRADTPRSAPDSFLYHYTSSDGVRGIIKDRAIWLTNAAYVNDEQELTYPSRLTYDVITVLMGAADDARLRDFLKTVSLLLEINSELKAWYIASFSYTGNALSQWRAYCPGGGYSLGFDGPGLVASFSGEPRRYRAGPVIYDPTQQRDLVRNVLARYIGTWRDLRDDYASLADAEYDVEVASILWATLAETCAFIKSPVFAEEQEWRLARLEVEDDDVLFRTRRNILTPYLSAKFVTSSGTLPLKDLFIGPLGDIQLAYQAARKLTIKDYPDLAIHVPEYRLRF